MKFIRTIGILIILAVFANCRKKDVIKPTPPDTKIFLDQINLSGKLRLGTTVQLHWTGFSANGYITGYEFSFDQLKWTYTQKTDSNFLFTLTKGQDSTDITIYIRAIDNNGQKDLSPASLKIPIKNSPPKVLFSTTKLLTDTVYTVFSIEWALHDQDGDATIDSLYIRCNDGAWLPLNTLQTFATFVPENPAGSGIMNALVYKDLNAVLLNQKLTGLNLNGMNRLYIKAKDNAGAESAVDSTGSFYLKGKKSDLLLINANTAIDPSNDILKNTVAGVYGKIDYINFSRDNQKYSPPYWNPTFNFLLKQYDKVFIYSDGLRTNGKLMLEYGASAIADFLNGGGKLLTSVSIPVDLDPGSSLYSFSPADSISVSNGQARFYKDSLAIPDPINATAYKPLKNASFILGFEPFYLKPDARVMYNAQITRVGGWKGPDHVCASMINTKGHTNQVFWSLDMSIMNGGPKALQDFFNTVLLHEFNW